MATFALKRGPSSRLNSLAVSDGAFIITTDTQTLWADIGTARYELGQILEVKNLPTTDINTAKYYYLTTDKCLYRYVDNEWVNLSRAGMEIVTGDTNGTIKVNGESVAVFGLGTAAFMDATAFDAAGAAAAVQGETTKTVADVEAEAAQAQADATKANEDLATLDESLAAVAKSGAAADVSIADEGSLFAATTVEAALAELAGAVGTTGEAGKVTVTASDSADYAKVYDIKQNGVSVGTINIPKDLVVKEGSVVTLTDGQVAGVAAGTYIKLVLQNNEDAPLYINAANLIEYVTSGSSTGDMIVVTVDADHKVTATITDCTVTKAKLTTDVQKSLGLADSAVQKVTVLGTELTNGDELTVDAAKTALGLKSAAYQEASAFDAAGAAADAKAEVIGAEGDAATANTIFGAKAHATGLNGAMDLRVQALETAIGEGGSVAAQIATEIGKLDVTDNAVANEYVSSVSQEDGKITVTRTALPDYTNTYDAKGAAATAKSEAISEVVGATSDAAEANTINGAKAYALAVAQAAVTWEEF